MNGKQFNSHNIPISRHASCTNFTPSSPFFLHYFSSLLTNKPSPLFNIPFTVSPFFKCLSKNHSFPVNNSLNIQEGGNVRSSTRIHAPPGGSSQAGSLIFGGAAPVVNNNHVSSNKFASGQSQNCGNHMTGRSSTRIHAPPGGSSQAGSLIFGGGNPSTEDRFGGRGRRAAPAQQNTYASTQHTSGQQQQQQQQSSSSSSFSNKEQFNYQNNVQTTQQPVAKKATQSRGISGNAYKQGGSTNQNCGNYITDRPTSRVLAPPGGKSSGPLW